MREAGLEPFSGVAAASMDTRRPGNLRSQQLTETLVAPACETYQAGVADIVVSRLPDR
jgi:hypothetical protein